MSIRIRTHAQKVSGIRLRLSDLTADLNIATPVETADELTTTLLGPSITGPHICHMHVSLTRTCVQLCMKGVSTNVPSRMRLFLLRLDHSVQVC